MIPPEATSRPTPFLTKLLMIGSRSARLLGSTVAYINAQRRGSHPESLRRAHEISGELLSWPGLRLFEKGDATFLPSIVSSAIDFLRSCPAEGAGPECNRQLQFLAFLADHRPEMVSQLGQELMVMFFLAGKRDGFFVEIGAGDGLAMSNTYLLEKRFGWKGILAEPNPAFHAPIQAKRVAALEKKAVYSADAQVMRFVVVEGVGEFSTLEPFAGGDEHDRSRRTVIDVGCTTIGGLLENHGAPHAIDYISIDTEGSEYEILKRHNFEQYDVSIFSIEHNFVPAKGVLIDELLSRQGYARVFPLISKWDGWYVKRHLLACEFP